MAEFHFTVGGTGVRSALSRIVAYLEAEKLPLALVEPAQIVLAEVFNNIEEHAYAGIPDGAVVVQLTPMADCLECRVMDAGRAWTPRHLPGKDPPPIDADHPATWPEGGFGWAIVRSLTRDVRRCRHGAENWLQFVICPDDAAR